MIELYRGFNKDYPNYGTKSNQNHLWTTDDEGYAYEYTQNFKNGGLVKYLVDDSKFEICNEFDLRDIFENDEVYSDIDPIDVDDNVCDRLIGLGYNVLCFETPSGYDVYCLLDKSLIYSAQEITPNIDQELEEVFKQALVENARLVVKDEEIGKIWKANSISDIKQVLPNLKFGARAIYDEKTNQMFFGSSYDYIHIGLLQTVNGWTKLLNIPFTNEDDEQEYAYFDDNVIRFTLYSNLKGAKDNEAYEKWGIFTDGETYLLTDADWFYRYENTLFNGFEPKNDDEDDVFDNYHLNEEKRY